MEYVATAYALIAIVLGAYLLSLWRRCQQVEREQEKWKR